MLTNEESKQNKSKSKGMRIVIGCLVVLAVLILALFVNQLFQRNRAQNRAQNRTQNRAQNRKEPVKAVYTPDVNIDRVLDEVPVFSADSGFYEEKFELGITSGVGEIYYTLDGSDPAGNALALLYHKPISIYDNTEDDNTLSAESDIVLGYYCTPNYNVDKGMIVRAVVKDNDGNYGKTVTKSYFVGKTKDYYQDMKVISLVTNPYNLFDPDDGIYVVGNKYYEWLKSADFDPAMEDWRQDNPTNYNQTGKEWERPATIQIFEQGVPVYEQDVAIRLAGNATRSNAQKSIRLYARKEYGDKKIRYPFFEDLTDINGEPIDKFDKITLRNDGNDTTGAFIRDELVQSLCSDLAVGVQAETPCILFIDGEFWGMYHVKERIEDYYFASHYGVEKTNVTYVKRDETEGSEAVRQEYEDFYKWAVSADLSDGENYKRVADVIDIQSLMDYFAIETYINNYDWLNIGKRPNNILMWRVNERVDGNPYGDGKWRFVLYDMEYSAGLYSQEGTKNSYDAFKNISRENTWANPGVLFFRLLENENFCREFYVNYIEIMDNNFDADRVNEWIDEYGGEYGDAISDTFKRYLSDEHYGHFNYHAGTVKSFYNTRQIFAKKYLDELCLK